MSDLARQITAGIVEDLEIRPHTMSLVHHLLWDLPLATPECVEYGVYTADHFRALKAVLENDTDDEDVEKAYDKLRRRIVALDRAGGSGPRLTALVRKYAPEYVERVKFRTVWDVICRRSGKDSLRSG